MRVDPWGSGFIYALANFSLTKHGRRVLNQFECEIDSEPNVLIYLFLL